MTRQLFQCSLALALAMGTWFQVAGAPANEPSVVELRGRVVCLAEEMNRLHGVELPRDHDHIWAFRSETGTFHTLLRGKMSAALFLDARLREKQLLLKARIFPASQAMEVMGNIRSVSGAKVFEVYYYCSVCAIKSILPELCMCCQEPVELKEVPVGEDEP